MTTTTALDRLTRVTDDYREFRAKLETATGELERLKDQRAATMQSSRDAGQQWRQVFKDAGGAAGKEVRELQGEERTLAAEIEQLDVLIDEPSGDEEDDALRTAAGRAYFQAPMVDAVTFVRSRERLSPGELVRCTIVDSDGYDLIAVPSDELVKKTSLPIL